MTPGEMGGFGICPKVLDEYYIDDIDYLWRQYEKSTNKVKETIDNNT